MFQVFYNICFRDSFCESVITAIQDFEAPNDRFINASIKLIKSDGWVWLVEYVSIVFLI